MKELVFCEGTADSYTSDFEPSLFNLQAHRALQATGGWISFHVLDHGERRIHASIHFHLDSDHASSPRRAPFGSVEFSNALSLETLFEFIRFAERQLIEKHVAWIRITNPPEGYSEHIPLLNTFLVNLGYRVAASEISAIIPVTRAPFVKSLHRSESKRLDRCKNEGMTFRKLPLSDLAGIYEFIHHCRTLKGFTLSMTLADLQVTVDRFPDRYLLFGLYHTDKLAAAALCIRVSNSVLYDFYHDHAREYDQYSPVVMLVSEIYNYCQVENIALLDLGTSAEGAAPNFGLLKFKMLLGGKPSGKFTFEKKLR